MSEAMLKTAPLSTRPILSRDEAAAYTREHYFARGGWLTEPDGPWHPAPVTSPPQGRVLQVDARKGPYRTVQQAVNAAVASGPRETGYQPGRTANGQALVRDSVFDTGFDTTAPWGAAATTGRPFVASRRGERNELRVNRLVEYQNRQVN
ncbi:hypothetical protein ACOZ0W_002555 [Cronobacter dublinensis]